jgi:hypothetical protein
MFLVMKPLLHEYWGTAPIFYSNYAAKVGMSED